jgi:hypothetical protein
MLRRAVRFAAISCVLSASVVHAQPGATAAGEIVARFGANGQLDAAAFKTYVNASAFKALDLDGSGALDVDEYDAAALYARLPDCGNARARDTWLEETKNGDLTADRLYLSNPIWRAHVDVSATAQWRRASPVGRALDASSLAVFLDAERRRQGKALVVADRLKRLSPDANQDVTSDQLRELFFAEWFERIDRDGSRTVTFVELTRQMTYPLAPIEFCALAGQGSVIRQSDLSVARLASTAPVLLKLLLKDTAERVQAISPLPRVPLALVRRRFEEEERDDARRAALAVTGDHGFVPQFGYLISGKRTRSSDGTVSWDTNQTSLFFRIIKDFTVDDPRTADPALFAITKERGTPAAFTIDTTFQLDVRPATFTHRIVAAGIDVERSTAGSGRNVETYYGTADVFLWHGGILESNYIRLSPFVEDDRIQQLTRLAGDILWQPGIRAGWFSTDQWLLLGPGAEWFVTPRAGLELGGILRSPAGSVEPDVTNARVELIAGVTVGSGFKATYRGLRRFPVGNDVVASGYQEASARWSFDEFDRFSVKGTVAQGRKTVMDQPISVVTFGIGVKF